MVKGRKAGFSKRLTANLSLTLAILLFWGVCMLCVTNVTAQSYYQLMYLSAVDWAERFGSDVRHYFQYSNRETGWLEYEILRSLSVDNYSMTRYGYSENESLNMLADPQMGYSDKRAAVFTDPDGNILFTTGNYAAFGYHTEEAWKNGQDLTDQYAYMNLTYEEALALDGEDMDASAELLRITGVMDGVEIRPFAVDYVTEEDVRSALDIFQEQNGSEGAAYSELDLEELLDWQPLFDRRTEAADSEMVTVYGQRVWVGHYAPGDPVIYDGTEYPDLMTLLLAGTENYHGDSNFPLEDKATLREIIDFDVNAYTDPETGEGIVQSVCATRCFPLREAIVSLRYVYLGTFIAAVLLIYFLRKVYASARQKNE